MSQIQRVLSELTEVFKSSKSKHEAHETCRKIMEQVSREKGFLTELLTRHLSGTEIYHRGHYPVVALDVSSNPEFTLSANCWIPYEGLRTDVATKPIHHHGELLMTTSTIFGPGYQHLVFNAPELLDEEQELYSLTLLESKKHSLHDVTFVDGWIPHLPLYPEALTITLALWSHGEATTWKDRLKHVPFIRRHERSMRELVNLVGLQKQLHLKKAFYYDFYPLKNGGFRGTPEKVEHIRGPHVDHLRSLFYILQRTGNEGLASVVRERLKQGGISRLATIEHLLTNLETGRPIEAFVSDVHVGVPYLSFSEEEIMSSMRANPRGSEIYVS